MRQFTEQTILNDVTPVALTSSTDATPVVVTATSHGFVTGDRVYIQGHTTNIAANGIFRATVLTANTFSLQDEFTGANVAGSGAGDGGASGFCMRAPVVWYGNDFKTVTFQIVTTGTSTMNIRTFASDGRLGADSVSPQFDFPNMGATISKTNPYNFLQLIKLDDGATVNGGTGIVVAGTDINNRFEANSNGVKYLTVAPLTWTQGAITVKAVGYYF